MGICSSSESISVATAKLILDDGRLQEFPFPVKVSYVLQKNPSCFICSSDEMDFDDVVSAISDDEELQPGQLYFALPLSRLRRRLQAEELAALAVKASSALSKCSTGYSCSDKGCSLKKAEFSGELFLKPVRKTAESGSRRRTAGGAAGRKAKFAARLSAIPE